MGTGAAQLVHGLRLSGDIVVPGAPRVSCDSVDFCVRASEAVPVPEGAPEGEVVAALDVPGTRYAAVLRGEQLTVRFAGTAEFEIDLAGGRIDAAPAPGREPMLPLLLGGNVVAIVLGLRGVPVLHASAVALDGAGLAVAGPSGVGKSTLAALLCAAGLPFVTDDTARLERQGDRFLVHHGPAELRLRGPAADLAAGLSASRRTPDGRTVASPVAAPGVTTPLGAVAFPAWSNEGSAPAVTGLGRRDALEALLGSPRVAGWRAQGPLRTNFDACAAVADACPAFRVEMPRGRLADPGLPLDLRAELERAIR